MHEAARPRPRLNLALQGGGSHGALTWGVLDALLEDGQWQFDGVSGTSAGAMNAVALAHGFAQAAQQHAGLAQVDRHLADQRRVAAEVGGGAWDYDKAWALLRATGGLPEPIARFELDRYLGWPGQAPSYKIGQRIWNELREEARSRAEATGVEFDMKAWHMKALSLGGLGLDVLREALR